MVRAGWGRGQDLAPPRGGVSYLFMLAHCLINEIHYRPLNHDIALLYHTIYIYMQQKYRSTGQFQC